VTFTIDAIETTIEFGANLGDARKVLARRALAEFETRLKLLIGGEFREIDGGLAHSEIVADEPS
jgi:hypothetical protein